MFRSIAVCLSLTGLTSAIDCNVQTNRFDQFIFPRNGYFSRNQGQLVNSQIDINSNCWLQWSGWSGCTGMCGNAVKTARRKCRNGIPGVTGTGCDGSEIKRRRCEPNEMVQGKETYCPYWSFWSEWGNCNVEASLDSCVRNMQGFSQRVRECHDPFATSVGEIPNCQGEPSEARACTSNQVTAAQIPNDQRYLMSDWSECSVQCGQGVQEMTLTHVCANTPGTWVSSTEFYQVRSQACITACCVPGQWNYEEAIDECTGGFTRKWRLYEDFAGGCAGVPNIKFVGGQYVEEEMLQVPISVPNDWQFPFIGENEQWSGCVPQPSPYEGNVLTTCGVNGIQTRTRRHPCVATCTSENCVWNQQPFVITEQRACGEQTVFEMRNTCNTNPCNPKCYQRVFCEGEYQTLTQVEVECPQNVCGIPDGVWIEPSLCTCGQTEKFRTWQHQCDQVGGEAMGCSPPAVVCKFSEWQESQQLILARNNNQCICSIWEDFYDLKQEQCDQLAEDNRVCSQFVGQMETRINAYASDICPGDEICEPCTRTCDMPNENPEIVNCHRQDICNPGVMVPSRTYTCPRKESCCTWGPWTVESECIGGFTCPSEAIGQVRREVRYNTCDQIQPEIREATCPPQACPIWNEFGDWSACSGVLADGTVCGGNRFRTRDYPCKQDVIAGNCIPQWPTGYSITDGNYDDLYNQFDSYSQQHHSQYCYDLYLKSESVVYSAWTDFIRDTENNGCVSLSNRIREISTRQKTDKCTGETVIETQFREIEVPACFDEGFVGAESCVYDSLGCTAQIKTRCIAQDVCGQSFERMSAVMATPEQCPPREELVESFDSACMQVSNNNFLSDQFCVGQAERTTRFKCQGAIVERVGCNIEPRWSSWSEFVPVGQFDFNYAVEYRTNVESFTQSVMCNPCGGLLKSTRQLLCSNNAVEEQVREINCPSPTYVWGPWSDCQIGCKQRPSDKCIENRFQTTTPEAMHCGLQMPQETREIPIPPCECQTQETERFCQHMDDPLATCGLGHVHEKTYYHTTNCVTGEILNTRVAEHVHGLNGQYEECALPFQPEYQYGAEIGCMSPEEVCLGGVITQSKSLICPQNSRPPYGRMWEATIIEATGQTCPGVPRVYISDWQLTGSDCMANECQTYRQEFRECVGGSYMDSCNCIEFGRGCCLRNPEYQLSDDGTREYRSVACPVRNVLTQIDIQDPDCECGVCEVSRCNQDRCTGEITGCYIYIQAEPMITTVSEWSDCQWNLLVGEDKCDIEGYRTREISTVCRNNRIVNEIEVETWQPSYAMAMTDNNNLVPQPVYNGLARCMHVPERRVLVSDCINVDSCNPYRVVQYLRVCDGIEIETESRQEPCQADETVDVTAWTECSVECGENGIRTRQHIRRCSSEIVKVDEEACGCAIAYWSDWTQPDGICDGCGPEVQYLTQSRTCIQPQARVYNGGDSYVNWMRNGGYNGYVPVANADQCAGKCNQCTPDTDGNANIRKMAYNRDSECSIPAEVVTGTCPAGEALCYTRNTFEITSWCGKEISRVEIPCRAPPAPPAAIESECSVVCGEGVKTITSYNSICDNTPTVTQVPCIGKWGKLVQASTTEWSSCSATCGGGSQQRYISTVCELNPDFEVERLVQKQNCALHPCAYWGGWSGWSMCSSTCGGGVRQRQRKCEGGNPGAGACTEQDEIYEDLFTGDRSLFSPSSGGSIHQESCNEGDCCAFEWSGWSNCCMNGQNRARQIKWKGNACTGEWVEEDQNCVEADIDIFGELPTCDAILSINKQYFTGYEEQRVIISETLQTINGNTVNRGWDQGYGKFIEDGIYVIEGVTYELENVGGVQQWYRIGQNQVRSLVEVEVFEYNKGLNLMYYYKFGDRWYRWMNGKFAYTGTPPFYQSEVPYVNNNGFQQWNGVNSNFGGNFNGNLVNNANFNGPQWQTNYVMSNPTANQFTYTNGASSIPFYRPVTSITEPVVVREPVVTEIVVDNGNVNGNFNNGNFNFGFNSMFNNLG